MYYLLMIIIIFLDQISKFLAKKYLEPIHTYPLIDNVFHLTYVENTGAAFSSFQGNKLLLIAFTSLLLFFMFFYFHRYVDKTQVVFKIALSMIIAGGFANLIDRIRLNYVIDFFDFRLINFAIFNIADSFVVIGVCIIFTLMILNKM